MTVSNKITEYDFPQLVLSICGKHDFWGEVMELIKYSYEGDPKDPLSAIQSNKIVSGAYYAVFKRNSCRMSYIHKSEIKILLENRHPNYCLTKLDAANRAQVELNKSLCSLGITKKRLLNKIKPSKRK